VRVGWLAVAILALVTLGMVCRSTEPAFLEGMEGTEVIVQVDRPWVFNCENDPQIACGSMNLNVDDGDISLWKLQFGVWRLVSFIPEEP
jgi:hypothetical protein